MESTVTSGDTNWTVHPEGQCNPLPTPHLGTFKLVTGNGTSVGTVMTLVCPYKHRAISGGRISCVQEGNITEWIGGIPECKLVTNLEGVRLALLLSVISTAIILLMSGMLFTSLLLKCLRKEEMRHLERGDVTVSSGSSLNLRSVRPDQSGIYTLMVRTRNYPLHRQKEFTVTVMNGTRPEPPSTTMETTPRVTTTHQPSVRTPTSQPQHTSSISDATATEVAYISASASSTGNVTVVKYTTPHAGVKSPDFTSAHTPAEDRTLCCTSSQGSTSREIHYVPSDTSTFVFASASISSATVRIGNDLTTKMTKQDDGASESHVVFVAVPFLLLLLLIVFLYRKYLVQKRLDMPPPFKPPPPPVKYTSARNHDMPVTDILV